MAEREGPCPPPPGIPDEWPVPWTPVHGSRDGLLPRAEAALVSGVLELAARMPERALQALLGSLARVAALVDRGHAAAGRRSLRQALGDLPERELAARVRGAYLHFLRVIVEPRRFLRRVPPERTLERFEVVWTEDARRVFTGGRGCLLVTGHVGNWEAGIAALPWLGLHPVYAVAKPPANRPLSALVQREREQRGVRVLPRRGAMRAAPRILRAGGALCLLVDQRARQRPVLAPFFGRPARCDRSVGVLMRRFDAPVQVCACYRTERPLHYRIVFEDTLWPEDLRDADEVEVATRVNAALERLVLAHPEQYFWIHDRYKKTPETFDGAPEATGGVAGRDAPGAGHDVEEPGPSRAGEPRGVLPS